MTDFDIDRRRVLAGIGGTGLAAFAGLGLATERSLAYTDRLVFTQTSSFTLEADWRETYNGMVLEDEDENDESPGEPVISLGDIKPGDNGVFSFRLELTQGGPIEPPELEIILSATPENGINDPERSAGDTTSNEGELEETLEVQLWYDSGLMNIDTFGGNNAQNNIGEPLIDQDAKGTLEDVSNTAFTLDKVGSCFEMDETIIVSFGWKFPSDAGNVIQTDSVKFTFEITSNLC